MSVYDEVETIRLARDSMLREAANSSGRASLALEMLAEAMDDTHPGSLRGCTRCWGEYTWRLSVAESWFEEVR